MDPTQTEVIGVSALSSLIEQTLSLMPVGIQVRGEVQKVRIFKDFWIFFDLVDEQSSLSCMCSLKTSEGLVPEEGSNVQLSVAISLGKRSDIRLRVLYIKSLDSLGSRLQELEELRLKLSKEGLFESSRKKNLPKYPQSVAVITAQTSSAAEDFKKIASSRWPAAKLQIFNVAVQGSFAAKEIIAAINEVNDSRDAKLNPKFDLIALVRGGGSRDDLAVFNKEDLVRAVAGSELPIIAGIGHEDDVSLTDFAADVRASTPSNAAELIFPDAANLSLSLRAKQDRLSSTIQKIIELKFSELQRLQELLDYSKKDFLARLQKNLDLAAAKIQKSDPLANFEKGWAFVQQGGLPLASVKDVKLKDRLDVYLQDGAIQTEVVSKE